MKTMEIGSEHGSVKINDFQSVDVETIKSRSPIATERLSFHAFSMWKMPGRNCCFLRSGTNFTWKAKYLRTILPANNMVLLQIKKNQLCQSEIDKAVTQWQLEPSIKHIFIL